MDLIPLYYVSNFNQTSIHTIESSSSYCVMSSMLKGRAAGQQGYTEHKQVTERASPLGSLLTVVHPKIEHAVY